MDFARCYGCRKLVWTSQSYIDKYGVNCPRCDSRMRQPMREVRGFARVRLMLLYVRWGFIDLNPWYEWALPWNFARAVWIGLHPEPMRDQGYNVRDVPEAEKQYVDKTIQNALDWDKARIGEIVGS